MDEASYRTASSRTFAIPAIVFVTLLVLGAFETVWANRREKANDPVTVRAKLQRASLTVGDWDGKDESDTLPELPTDIGPTVVRRYVDRRTRDVISVLLSAGEPGSILVNHQPTDCYPGIGYNLTSGPVRYAISGDSTRDEFLTALFTKTTGPAPSYLRVFWSFSGSGAWEMPRAARIAFSRYPTVYKVYVIRQLRKPDEPLADDPMNGFLRVFLPELRKSIFDNR
jgi:hypothetical protein